MFVFMPETLRSIVGDGSIPAPRFNRPLVPILLPKVVRQGRGIAPPKDSSKRTFTKERFLQPFRLMIEKDIGSLLLFNGITYLVYVEMTTSMSTLFASIYHLSETQIGLCFLAGGAGAFASSQASGRMLNYNFRVIARREKLLAPKGEDGDSQGKSIKDLRKLHGAALEVRLRTF